jgi:hypothetical protein
MIMIVARILIIMKVDIMIIILTMVMSQRIDLEKLTVNTVLEVATLITWTVRLFISRNVAAN